MFAAASSGPKLWRIAALVLLLSAAFDIAAVDTALLVASDGSGSCCNCSSDDGCFCCSRHLVMVDSVVFRPLMVATSFLDPRVPSAESISSPVPHLPPRA
jgi:hypothetical protein